MATEKLDWVGPAEGTLERLFIEKLLAAGDKGVTFFDFVGTGITEDNIDQIADNLRRGMYVPDGDEGLKFDA